MCTSFNRFFDKVAEWQDKNVKKVEVMGRVDFECTKVTDGLKLIYGIVNSFLPQDWRARLMQSQRAKSEVCGHCQHLAEYGDAIDHLEKEHTRDRKSSEEWRDQGREI